MSTGKSLNPHSNRHVAKSASIISLGILCSRILGFARDLVIARLFGVYAYAQAFVVAFKIPNLFRDFIGEGATNAVFVPVFSEYLHKLRREEFWELANIVLNLLLVILMSITILGIVFSPLIVRLVAPGFIDSSGKLEATIRLTQVVFPYIILVGLFAFFIGLLNTLGHFTVPAFAPCLLNISVIIFALIFGESLKGLALGVLIGGLLQLAIQLPVAYKKGFKFKFTSKFNHPAVKEISRLLTPRIFSSSIYQLNNFMDTIFGSFSRIVGEGGVAVLYFSYHLFLFPLAIVSTALSQAILPTFSRLSQDKDSSSLKNSLFWGLRTTFFIMLPASVGLMVLARPLVSTLFGGGRFDAYAVSQTAGALVFYSIGLSSYGATKILQSCFFALKDTRTPAKVTFLAFITNIVLNAILMFPLKIGGIALATSISGICSFLLLLFLLKDKIGDFHSRKIASSFLRMLSASLGMGAVCYFVSRMISFNKSIQLSLGISAGVFSYILFCLVFKVKEMQEFKHWFTRRELEVDVASAGPYYPDI